MKIIEFNIEVGRYRYELEEMNIDFHSHPAVEFLFAKNGFFTLETKTAIYSNLSFAVIPANLLHRVEAKAVEIDLLMLECSQTYIQHFLTQNEIFIQDGIYSAVSKQKHLGILDSLSDFTQKHHIQTTDDHRILQCLNYFKTSDLDYNKMIDELSEKVNLSKSHLSHVFSSAMGLSLKKYLVWSRLKRAIDLVVHEKMNLYDASLQSGFFDQAHLSKAFKQMLGINPSGAYNRRIVQDS